MSERLATAGALAVEDALRNLPKLSKVALLQVRGCRYSGAPPANLAVLLISLSRELSYLHYSLWGKLRMKRLFPVPRSFPKRLFCNLIVSLASLMPPKK